MAGYVVTVLRRGRWAVRGAEVHAIGSGSVFARGSLKKLYTDGTPADDAIRAGVDEFSEVLVKNVEDFVRSYVQKGGQ